MQKHPLLSVKEAAEMLKLDERSVRERLINGQLKGEKRSIGLREKWFVYSGSLEAAMGKQNSFAGDPIGLTEVTIDRNDFTEEYDSEIEEQVPNSEENWIESNRDKVKLLAEEIVKPMLEKLDAQSEVIFEQRKTIQDQERQLRLLPDLQKQASNRAQELDLKHVENEALKKQVLAMEAQLKAKDSETMNLADDLSAIKEKLQEIQKPWWKKWLGSEN